MQHVDQIDAALDYLARNDVAAEVDRKTNALKVTACGRAFRLVFRDPPGTPWRHPIANTTIDWQSGRPDADILSLFWKLRFEIPVDGDDVTVDLRPGISVPLPARPVA